MGSQDDHTHTSGNAASDDHSSDTGNGRDKSPGDDTPTHNIHLDASSDEESSQVVSDFDFDSDDGSIEDAAFFGDKNSKNAPDNDSDHASNGDSCHDDLYAQDLPNTPAARVVLLDSHQARDDCPNWQELYNAFEANDTVADEDTVDNYKPPSPDSPPCNPAFLPDYGAVEASAQNNTGSYAKSATGSSPTSRNHPATEGRRSETDNNSDLDTPLVPRDREGLKQGPVDLARTNKKASTSPDQSDSGVDVGSNASETDPTTQNPSLQRYKPEHLRSSTNPPPTDLIDLLNKADRELMSDIDNLRFTREAVLRKASVITKYFSKDILVKLCPWRGLLDGYMSIQALERHAMPERQPITVMMAVPDPPRGPT
ncbi:hypothetical protein CC86DRAFT_411295 [Ophiobolus disseminans]|uniref:Uncharacterized protein n=1 Tax=Ophiobolus disseminans TaxID=1469910 RepID=A0A6A6ZJQ2_9PLEO|nr:hypothetical protein CC86DRAFT_411295 [Ophiobolus disseminans]